MLAANTRHWLSTRCTIVVLRGCMTIDRTTMNIHAITAPDQMREVSRQRKHGHAIACRD